jgi:hypothetical protein
MLAFDRDAVMLFLDMHADHIPDKQPWKQQQQRQ